MKLRLQTKVIPIILGLILLGSGELFAQKNNVSTAIPIADCGVGQMSTALGVERQANCSQNFSCDDATIRDGYIYDGSQPMKIVKTKARIVRDDNGLNPTVTDRAVALEYHHLNKDFAQYGIQFTYIIEYLDNSAMLTIDNDNELGALFFNYATETDEYCNVFFTWYFQNLSLGFFPWQTIPGGQQIGHLGSLMNTRAQVYPWNMRSTLTHEFGHMLGLEHTFRGAQEVGGCFDNCAENMSSTGDDVGDWCSDTPPQDRTTNPGFNPTNDCNGIPFNSIPHTNYMSYTDNKLVFTPQQVARMHCYLGSHPLRTGWVDNTNPTIPYVNSDNFGYEFTEEENINPSEWVDISTTGVEITGLLDDNIVGPFDIGFDGGFYGQNFSEIYVGSNGYISLSPININPNSSGSGPIFGNIPLQNTNNNFFAPFLTDLRFNGAGNIGKIYFWSNDVDTFIITYENVPFFDNVNGFSGSNTFQMIYEKTASNPDGLITYQYLDMEEYYPSQMHFRPNPILIGIENADGTDGLEIDNYRIPQNNSRVTIGTNLLNIEDISLVKNSISVFPNPTNENITVNLGVKYNSVEFQLYNTMGQKIKTIKKQNIEDLIFPIEEASGIYFLKVVLDDTYANTIKVIKK